MIKDYSEGDQGVVSAVINKSVEEIEKNNDLDFYEKVDVAYDKTVLTLDLILTPQLDETSKEEVKKMIKEMITSVENKMEIFEDFGYKPWLENRRTDINWNHRELYHKYLTDVKHWSISMYKSIHNSTDMILDHMGDPEQKNDFTKKGLVIGDVQSGKTANYTALINKSIDAGYKLVIVLAGQQNDLRTQTQDRLDKEVLGYETSYSNKVQNGEHIGVGKLIGYNPDIDSLTNRSNSGDFKRKGVTHLLSGEMVKPVIAVVKKNTTVLKNLYDYLSKPVNLSNITHKLQIPVLIIDDEVDQASVNTKKNPDEDPTRINGRIRDIVNLCSKVSYVGYTATPYANVLIDSNVHNENFGDDLFPKDFIAVLPTPPNYCGVEAFFGSGNDLKEDLIVSVDDMDEFVEKEEVDGILKLKSDDEIATISTSLKEAVKDFIVASAVRRSRGEKTHNGMMVHIAAYKRPATSLRNLLEDYIDELRNNFAYDYENSLSEYYDIWRNHFQKVSIDRNIFDDWNDIKIELPKVFELLKTKLLNGDSKDIIDYNESTQSQIIAVGGNKLSRGITIEGLMVSYYLRDPQAYDTAMQMGRWFGYKESYIDLCRIYSQPELIANFIHIFEATKLLREDIRDMNDRKMTPDKFGIKILAHPAMLPTARNKMRNGTRLDISFCEQRAETIKFDLDYKEENLNLVKKFVEELKNDVCVLKERIDEPIFRNVEVKKVLNFLKNYHDYVNDGSSNVKRWINYIEKLNKESELSNWTVMISNVARKERSSINIAGYEIIKAKRKNYGSEKANYVRAISNPNDFKYFFKEKDKNREIYRKGYVKNDDVLKELFNKNEGLLVIYPIDITDFNDKNKILEESVCGLGLWFPYTANRSATVNYIVNSVYSEDEDSEDYDYDE